MDLIAALTQGIEQSGRPEAEHEYRGFGKRVPSAGRVFATVFAEKKARTRRNPWRYIVERDWGNVFARSIWKILI